MLVNETLFSHQQAYRIVVNKNQATVIGASPVGVWYGLQTLMQLMKLFPPKEGIPALTVIIWKVNWKYRNTYEIYFRFMTGQA